MIALPQLRAIGRRGIAGLALDLQFASDKSLTPRVGPTPTYSRASGGTYFDSLGVLQTAAINAPRFDHRLEGGIWVSKGLLVEGQRTNIGLYSEDISNAAWTKASVSVLSNVVTAPDGTLTGDKLVEDALSSPKAAYQSFSAATITSSCFVKSAGESRLLRFQTYDSAPNYGSYFNPDTGVFESVEPGVTVNVQNVGNGWYRVSATYIAGTGTRYIALGLAASANTVSYTGNGASGLYVWGAQIEAGVSPSSYVKTTSASATRSADVCEITGASFSGFWNASAGSLYSSSSRDTGFPSASEVYMVVAANDQVAATTSIENTSFNTNNLLGGVIGLNVEWQFLYSPPIQANQQLRLAQAFSANDFAGSRNGSVPATDAIGSVPSVAMLSIGRRPDVGFYNNAYYYGHIAAIQYYNQRLTNAELQTLTT